MTSSSAPRAALELSGLSVHLVTGEAVLEGVDLRLEAGEILGIVGESGSGKTTAALSLFGYATPGTRITGGELRIAGEPHRMDESMRPIRGATISYVPQDPSRALNPSLKIAAAINDVLRAHAAGDSDSEAAGRVLSRVGLGDTGAIAARYPHQTSGGQQQRVSIAIALCCDPAVVVLDEPTTGLDVVTQARILEELRSLRTEQEVSMVYVTHDLSVLAEIADRIAVMYAGRVVEEGPAERLLRWPRHPYTRGLLASIPDHVRPRALEPMPGIAVAVGEWPPGCRFAPRCPQRSGRCEEELPPLEPIAEGQQVRCFHYQATPQVRSVSLDVLERRLPESVVLTVEDLGAEHKSHREVTVAATSISFSVSRGECVALVGESGSGKTTVARTIAGLHPIARGRVLLHGTELASLAARRTREQRRQIQIVFQNPAGTLNPQHTVFQTLARPARVLRKLDRSAIPAEVHRLLECVRLPARIAERYPHELSGGERQRVAIARALAADPEIILCDEITSALDVSVQAAVLELLRDLRDEFGLGLLFITHDLGVVATVADTVLVLDHGSIVDHGPTSDVLGAPSAEYTARLLQAAPSISHSLSRRSGTQDPPRPTGSNAASSGVR